MSFDETFDVIVIGAGHAGCEAASASARMGARTALITMNLDAIGQMSCNPAIGGVAKGNIVREIDALGGVMGRVIDRTGIQFRLLNRSRGRAVQSPRAQADRALYRAEMRLLLENTENLHLLQGTVLDLIIKDGVLIGVELQDTRRIGTSSTVFATGTFLNGLVHTGRRTYTAGRAGEPASTELAETLKRLGFPMSRLKTGTPPRLDGRTIDWNAFEIQYADKEPVPFSFSTKSIKQPQIACHLGYTNQEVHDKIRENIAESPLYSGQIQSTGPRYCPSIEDKVVKFPTKTRHQLFLEPEGFNTHEVYLNGFSTSLPSELQQQTVRLIPGFEETLIVRPGYAIEYDFIDPRDMSRDLHSSRLKGLFLAGQINGTTGYEEAACQGLVAGINAALYSKGKSPFMLSRESSYIGVLIDDLVRHGVDEPYRMFTSRSERRLSLRFDTADERLSPKGRELGLVDDEQWDTYHARRARLLLLRTTLESTRIRASDDEFHTLSNLLPGASIKSVTLSQLVHHPEISAHVIIDLLPHPIRNEVSIEDIEHVSADILYQGYIQTQDALANRLNNQFGLKIPESYDYSALSGLSHEMVVRLRSSRPTTFGSACKIPGMTPGALATLLYSLRNQQAA